MPFRVNSDLHDHEAPAKLENAALGEQIGGTGAEQEIDAEIRGDRELDHADQRESAGIHASVSQRHHHRPSNRAAGTQHRRLVWKPQHSRPLADRVRVHAHLVSPRDIVAKDGVEFFDGDFRHGAPSQGGSGDGI